MGCIDCEVPAAAPGWGVGVGGYARERERERGGGGKRGIWRSADYAEQNEQLAEKAKKKKKRTITNRREGDGKR